ncbi:hypothetical protein F5Y16DRAFT_246995 [Xylariaceae sp. FL0255]|nr:hypothetical protein F5Y16DRAFT_246995 [Xylariaceae sp. FL0255]
MASRLLRPLLRHQHQHLPLPLQQQQQRATVITAPFLSALHRRRIPPLSSSFLSARHQQQMAQLSTPPAGKFEFLVIVPDKPGMQDKRMEVRPSHLEGTKPNVESGMFKTGGALLNEKPESSDPSTFSFYGSTLTCVASSKEEIIELLSKDIYAKTGVWDLEKVQIWPLKTAFREP